MSLFSLNAAQHSTTRSNFHSNWSFCSPKTHNIRWNTSRWMKRLQSIPHKRCLSTSQHCDFIPSLYESQASVCCEIPKEAIACGGLFAGALVFVYFDIYVKRYLNIWRYQNRTVQNKSKPNKKKKREKLCVHHYCQAIGSIKFDFSCDCDCYCGCVCVCACSTWCGAVNFRKWVNVFSYVDKYVWW